LGAKLRKGRWFNSVTRAEAILTRTSGLHGPVYPLVATELSRPDDLRMMRK